MDENTIGILTKVLDENELEQIPKKIRKKVENYFEHRFEEFLTSKALGETARNSLDEVREKFEKQVSDLTSVIQDYEAKLEHSQQNVNELREQLDMSRQEVTKLLESTNRHDSELNELRRDRNEAVDERDSLLKIIERRNTEIDRLQDDNKTLEGQLKQAIHVKCEALAKIDEIQSKEITLDFKEKRMEQERSILTNQIQTLSEDLNRNIAELQTIRRDNTMRNLELDTKLNEKTEELKIANSQISHLNEIVGSLTNRAEELATKLLQQHEESNKMMEYYKKELHAKTKLADLYKDSSDDKVEETNELSSAVTDLKKMLSDATEQYGELETKLKSIELKHDQDIDIKNEKIQLLEDELKTANEILKDAQSENLENAIAKLAPSAAVSSRLIKSDMSLTELYTKFFKTTEDLQYEKNENKKLDLQLKTILQELEEKAPIIKKQTLDYQKVLEANQELTNQLESFINEKVEGRHEMEEAMSKIGLLERENKKLKVAQTDLARQVCYLLKEVEQVRGGYCTENEQSISSDMNADEVISKRLVTFGKISELQENNQKLLLLVRDLSSKLEEMEEIQNNIDQASYESKINNYTKRIHEMQQTLEHQSEMLNMSMQKIERYKKLYYDVLKMGANNSKVGVSTGVDGSIGSDNMDGIEEETPLASNSSSIISTNEAIASKEKRIIELDELNKELKQQIKSLKEEHDDYIKEKKTNEKMMNEQFDAMRTELRELTSTNCKLMSTVEYNNEQIKIQQKNTSTYKKQISTLEDRNKNYENTIVKHEQTIMYLKDETLNSQKKLAHTEVQLQNLKQECHLLKDSQTRLQLERESLHRERQTQHLLMNNLEMIKASFERSETEGKIRLESRLDEAIRECSALRRRLQEEQDNFRELTVHLKRQTDTAKERMEEEKSAADKLRSEVANLRSDITSKISQIDDLSRKLQESLTPSKNDNPIAQANKKAREFEIKYDEAKLEIQSLQKDLETVREHSNQYCKMSQSSEQDLCELHQSFKNYQTESESEINKLRLSENNLKSRVDELETEIRLQITDAQINNGSATNQVQKIQTELKEALQKLAENNRELRDLREQCNLLTSSLQAVEQKYANEMIQHSVDIQELVKLKEDLLGIREKISELKSQRDKALSVLEQSKHGWTETEIKIKLEKDELEKRLIDLDAQNSQLHDQIQSLSTKLSVQNATNPIGSHNESTNETSGDNSLINRSITDEDAQKGNDQLLQIIKYLRKEKDIAFAKVDILKSENVRLISEQRMLQKRVDELNSSLNSERTQSESVVVTANRHEEILRKVETLNAVTDSNRILREERDTLSTRVKELTIRVTKVEDELFPLQEKNRELLTKIEECTAESTSLRTEALRWRQRANVLIERSNKNPEEFKRLQNERESLAKMLTAEKEIIRQTNDELNSIRTDKGKLEIEMNNLNRQILNISDEKKKITDDFNTLKQQNGRLTHEIMELKNQLLQREEDIRKANEEIASKEAQLLDSRNKEMQIRKIAKKYKDSFFELKNKTDGIDNNLSEGGTTGNTSGTDTSTGVAGEGSSKQQQDLEQKDKINELNMQIKALEEDADKLRKENDEFKLSAEKDDRSKMLLREAKTRIMNLTETKNSIIQELSTTKQLLQNNRVETEARISSEYESRISRLEKEYNEQENQIREQMLRLQRENETLLMRVNQLHRQLGMQPKPSTSSGSSSSTDKSATESSSTSTSTTTNPRTANVKPIGQQSATVTPWRGSETPLASIRPMTVNPNSRTAAILPTSQTASTAAIQGTSSSNLTSTASVTALVPPQQQVHTTAGNSSVEAMSSSPTSSHTDYMPATSSAAVVVATIPPMASAAVAAESSQEAESVQQGQQDIQQVSIALPATPSTASASSSSQQQQMIVSGGSVVVVGGASGSAASLSSSSSANSIQGQQMQQQQQQAVALVSPRVTDGIQNIVVPQQQIIAVAETNNQPASTSAGGNISSIVVAPSTSATGVSVSSHHQASSSNTVTTSQAAGGSGTSSHGHKRPRTDVEGDSSTSAEETPEKSHHHHHHHHQPVNKRTRIQITGPSEATSVASLSGGVSESGLDVEYQVPTSSQRDQEDDIIIVDSEEDEEDDDDDDDEEDGMADEGNADVDDSGPMEEDEADNGDGYEMESYEQEQDLDENEGPDIDEDNNVAEDTNEVEIDESCSEQIPNQSTPDAGRSQIIDQSGNQSTASTSGQQPQESSSHQQLQQQQIQTISSGSSEAGSSVIPQTSSSSGPSGSSSSWRQNTPLSRQQQATLLMLQQGFNDEAGDDSIVPSTPTLYVPRRAADGFSEAVSSPHPQVPHAARFTFAESPASTVRRQSVGESSVGDDSRVDTGDDGGRTALSAPLRVTPPRDVIPNNATVAAGIGTVNAATSIAATIGEGSSSTENIQEHVINEPVAGPSHSTEGSTNETEDETNEGASQSEVIDLEQHPLEESEIEEGEGLDGVSSEGEKANTGAEELEEGREAEASISPTINTRSRSVRGSASNRKNMRMPRGGRPTPIVWQDNNRGGAQMNRNVSPNMRGGLDQGVGGVSPQRGGNYQMQRGQRARRMRRPSGPNYGGNMRY